MLYVYSSNIRTGHFADLEKWLGENQKEFAAAQPQSWTLLGIYFTAFGLGPAHVEIHWEIEKYGSFDVAHANAGQGTPFNTFLNKLHSFLDPATGSARLLKAVGGGRPEFQRLIAQDAARIVGC
jgi:hypothetical protein